MHIIPLSTNKSHFLPSYTSAQQQNVSNTKSKKMNTNTLSVVTLGAVLTSTIILLNKTSRSRLENIAEEAHKNVLRKKSISNNKINPFLNIRSLKDDNSVLSLDNLSGLEKLKEFINKQEILLKSKNIQKEHNIEPFSSMLLWGVPGTGKTSAAMGIAKKLDADFVRLDKEIFDSEFISRGPRQLAECFREIKEHANSNPKKNIIVFMDEIDSTMAVDKGMEAKQDDVMVNTLKQGITDLQRECDNILFIGATNKDPNGLKSDNTSVRLNTAILSRFNYQFEIGLPEPKNIKDAWAKLVKTNSGKEKFSDTQNDLIAQAFSELGMSYRDIKNISNKLNIEDAVEFCKKGSYNSCQNLISVIKNDEKIGYDTITKTSMAEVKKKAIIEKLEKSI